MIATRMENGKGETILLFVLEPGNLEKLKRGEPIHKWLNEFLPGLPRKIELLLAYTPDIEWVAQRWQEMLNCGESDSVRMAEVIAESLTRRPVVDRSKSAEDLKRVF